MENRRFHPIAWSSTPELRKTLSSSKSKFVFSYGSSWRGAWFQSLSQCQQQLKSNRTFKLYKQKFGITMRWILFSYRPTNIKLKLMNVCLFPWQSFIYKIKNDCFQYIIFHLIAGKICCNNYLGNLPYG